MESSQTDRFFENTTRILGIVVLVTAAAGMATLVILSLPAIRAFGPSFLWNTNWNPVQGRFGALPFVVGTLVTTLLALLISTPLSLGTSIFLSDYASPRLAQVTASLVDLLAAIPSVIYGLWGIFFMVPLVRRLEIAMGITPYGVGSLTASLILAIMILPYATSVIREVLCLVPQEIKEGAYALGATRWEVIRYVVLPYARSGIFAGTVLAMGRAIGETMAVTMVIGNRNEMMHSIFEPANTMASVIANEFTEATTNTYLASLVEIGLILFLITLVVNIIARIITERLKVAKG